MNIADLVRPIQRKLGVDDDGIAGPQTWAAIYAAIIGTPWAEPADPPDINDLSNPVDARSEKAILTLLPEVRPYARALVHAAADHGIRIVVTSGTRTYEEQNDLYEQGRSKPGTQVTNARGGFSNHNFGVAFDVTIFDGARPVWESPAYKAVGALGRSIGLSWGGDWKSMNDEPHFELRPAWSKDLSESEMIAGLRNRKANGEKVFA